MGRSVGLRVAAATAAVTVVFASLIAYAHLRHAGHAEGPPTASSPAPRHWGGVTKSDMSGRAGAGWSDSPQTDRAVEEAIAAAGTPDGRALTMLFYTPHHDPGRVLEAARASTPAARRIIGMTTHEGLLTADGYHSAETGVVGALTLALRSVSFGIGLASFEEGAPTEAAKLATARALSDAGKDHGEHPSLLVLFGTVQREEALLAGVADTVGPDVPLLGGTAAGLVSAMDRRTPVISSSIVADGRVVKAGVGIAAFFSAEPFALAFGGGFSRGSGKGGTITSSAPRLIRAIDGRPAAEVYDEWLGGRISEARAAGKNVQNVLALYPFVKAVTRGGQTHNQFIRAWPSDDPSQPGSLRTGADIHDGDVIYTSEGSESILLNRFAAMPLQARKMGGDRPADAGLLFYCAGALQTIPVEHRGVLASLVQRSMGDIPWIGLFTWGEQGSVPGIGYQHGNLMASTALFPRPVEQ